MGAQRASSCWRETCPRVYQGAGAATIRQVFLEVLDQAVAYRDRPPAPGEPPYKGLRYFDEANAALFFGREWLTARLAGHPLCPSCPLWLVSG